MTVYDKDPAAAAVILFDIASLDYEMNRGNNILFFRKIILNNKILPKEKFVVLNDFLRQVIKADKSKLVLAKN